jgi:serine/threonine protein kinase
MLNLYTTKRLAKYSKGKNKQKRLATLTLAETDLSIFFTDISLGYEMVVPQCKAMSCGDIIYRSTLDPVLRMEQQPLAKIEGLCLLGTLMLYLLQRPGVIQGFYDTYIIAPLERMRERAYTKEDFRVGRRLATGGFGEVYQAELLGKENRNLQVILKRAKGFGEAEVWMNERCMRACPSSIAQFITAFGETENIGDPLWICWVYEGDTTLWSAMQKRDFPFNIENTFKQEFKCINVPKADAMFKDVRRRRKMYAKLMKQILENLASLHDEGIVHRDVKPQNMILSNKDQRIKLIDLGAAADLRIGINYEPNEYLLDPRYAPPQQYIMSTSTPRAPPTPLAALLSPVLWQLNKPDRFDMYSAGMVMLQIVFPNLRSDTALFAFNKKLAYLGYDIKRWKESCEVRLRAMKDPALYEGFEVLELDGGAGWDLLCQLLKFKPEERISAREALAHSFCQNNSLLSGIEPKFMIYKLIKKAERELVEMFVGDWMLKKLYKGGQLTETKLESELADIVPRCEMRPKGSATMAFWKTRQAALNKKLQGRRTRSSKLFKRK